MWIWSFVVGCCMGSFLNVVALRLQKEENFIRGHSHCVECLHKLRWIDLIPVLSWMWLRGKCRYCGRNISSRYWVVEVISGCMFMLMIGIWNGREWMDLMDLWLLISLAIFCSLTDLQEQVIYPKGLLILSINVSGTWFIWGNLYSRLFTMEGRSIWTRRLLLFSDSCLVVSYQRNCTYRLTFLCSWRKYFRIVIDFEKGANGKSSIYSIYCISSVISDEFRCRMVWLVKMKEVKYKIILKKLFFI